MVTSFQMCIRDSEAIRPTDITRLPAAVKDSLSRDQFRLYQLIWKRFTASCMAEDVYKRQDYVYLGIAGQPDAAGVFDLEQRNKFSVGETIEIMKPDGRNIEVTVEHIQDLEGNEQESAPHAKQALKVRCV